MTASNICNKQSVSKRHKKSTMKGLRSSAATSVTFVANPFARMDYLKKDNMLLSRLQQLFMLGPSG